MNENTPQHLATDDPRTGAAVAVETVRKVVAGVRPDQLDNATPCADYTVRDLLGHLVCAFRRLDVAGRHEDANQVPIIVPGIADDAYDAALEDAAHAIMATWSGPAKLDEMIVLPFAEMPGAMAVGMYTGEYFSHAWDLAVATGQTIAWPDEVLAPTLMGAKMGLPGEGREDPEMPFEPVVAVADDAPLIEQLVAWSGRDPKAWPSAA